MVQNEGLGLRAWVEDAAFGVESSGFRSGAGRGVWVLGFGFWG
jgi:hypothetical protein